MNTDQYIIYLRKSRADNPQESVEEVLARHERILQEFAVRTIGSLIPPDNIYREVVSGETIDGRPEMQKVLSVIEDPCIKGVLVIEPQRLSRGDWEDGGKILSSFKYSNTLILTPNKTYNLSDKFDYKFFKMELSQGNEYLEYTKEILARGRAASTREGNYIGSVAPYGYRKVYDNGSPSLEPYEPEAAAVRLAVNLRVLNNLGWSRIAAELEKAGYRPRKGEHWNVYTLRDICTNPVNIGKIKIDDRKTVKVYVDGQIRLTRPRNKHVIYVQGKHDPILDPDLFRRLLKIAGRTTRENRNSELVNPLAGLIYCANCGHAMSYRTYKGTDGSFRSKPRLLCQNQVHCKTKSSEFKVVYEAVIFSLEKTVEDFTFMLTQDQDKLVHDAHEQALLAAQEELALLETRQNDLYDLLENHIYTREVFLQRNQKLASERESLEKRIEYLKNTVPEPKDYETKIKNFTEVINTLKDDAVSAKTKNTMLKTIVSRIEYDRNSENRTRWDDSLPSIRVILKDV